MSSPSSEHALEFNLASICLESPFYKTVRRQQDVNVFDTTSGNFIKGNKSDNVFFEMLPFRSLLVASPNPFFPS